jgi:hypothetical protein
MQIYSEIAKDVAIVAVDTVLLLVVVVLLLLGGFVAVGVVGDKSGCDGDGSLV